MKIFKSIVAILFISSMPLSSAYAQFNLSKLNILCEHISSNAEGCAQEVEYLKVLKKNNLTLKYCSRNTNELSSFENCLKNNANPMYFLEYKTDQIPSEAKVNFLNKEMLSVCEKSKDYNNCLIKGGMIIEKSKRPFNWIENHCVLNSEKYSEMLNCEKTIRKGAYETKSILSKTPILLQTLDKLNGLFLQKQSMYLNQAFKVCEDKYGVNNIGYSCSEKLVSPVKEELVYLELKTLPCFKEDTLSNFIKCVKK